MVKKHHGSLKSSVTGGSGAPASELECKPQIFNTRLLILIESISGLENSKVKTKRDLKYPVEVKFNVCFGDEDLGTSEIYFIPDTEEHVIDYSILHTFTMEPTQALLSQPLHIYMMGSGGKDKSSKKGSSRGTRSTANKSLVTKSLTGVSETVLMEGILDLLPLVFGEIELEEKVGDLLEVVVRLDGAKLRVPTNLLYVTVENLYNPPADFLASDTLAHSLDLNIDCPSDCYKNIDNTGDMEWSKLNFGTGHIISLETGPEVPAKRWFSVQNGPPVLSQYRNLPDEDHIRDPNRVLSQNKSSVYVNWNQICRVFLEGNHQEKLVRNLVEDGRWQMEIYIKKPENKKNTITPQSDTTITSKVKSKSGKSSKKSDEKKKGKKDAAPLSPVSKPEFSPPPEPTFLVKFDLTELLQPGVNCTRVIGQLERVQQNSESSVDEALIYTDNLSKGFNKSLSKIDDDTILSNRVLDYEGRPCYISMIVELYSSFRPRKTEEELMFSVGELVSSRDKCPSTNYSVISPFQAREKYKTTILDNIHYLNSHYQKYIKENKTKPSEGKKQEIQNEKNADDLNNDTKFKLELERSGAIDLVKRSINEAVIELLKVTKCQTPQGLCNAYCQLIQETHKTIEEGAKLPEPPGPHIRATSDELLEAAREASEDDNYECAQQYLLKRLYYYGERDPDKWRDVAVLCLRHGDSINARQALITALCYQPRHRDSLLMLAVLSSEEGKIDYASTLFEALTTFYPRFYKGWFSYNCFFESVENKQGADVCLSLGSVCLSDRERDEGEIGPTYWCTDLVNHDRDGFILTAIYLLSLNLWQFAEMSLSHHRMEVDQDTIPYLYYLSVAHHLQGKFKESNFHIKQALSISWNDERLWNLMGHNLYRLHAFDRAVDCYKLVLDEPDPYPSFSLTFYRMGKIMFNKSDYKEAAKYFLKAVKVRPSSFFSWIQLAKASYWMGNMDDAELAAREANRLDEQSSDAWALLALVNFRHCTQPYLAQQCLSLAQDGKIDEELQNEINGIINTHDCTFLRL